MRIPSGSQSGSGPSLIVVVGGYGRVGRVVCSELVRRSTGRVVAAGRSSQRAEAFARSMHGRVFPRTIDIRWEPERCVKEVADADLIIMCLDQPDKRFVEGCLPRGIHYVDVSADYPFLHQVKQLNEVAVAAGAVAVLCVGLSPGLTNLLAAACHALLERTDHVDISLLLGTGNAHGVAAIRWTVEALLNTDIDEDTKEIDFGPLVGKRTALQLDFADQYTLRETLGVGAITTRLSLNVGLATAALVALRRRRPPGRVRSWLTSASFARILSRTRIGSDMCAVKVDAYGDVKGRARTASGWIAGRQEAVITGVVAARVAELALSNTRAPGVHYVDEILSLADVCTRLERVGLRIEGPSLA